MRTAIKKRTYVTAPAIITVVACLVFFLAPGITVADTSLNPSPELKTLLKHAEKAFLQPMDPNTLPQRDLDLLQNLGIHVDYLDDLAHGRPFGAKIINLPQPAEKER